MSVGSVTAGSGGLSAGVSMLGEQLELARIIWCLLRERMKKRSTEVYGTPLRIALATSGVWLEVTPSFCKRVRLSLFVSKEVAR